MSQSGILPPTTHPIETFSRNSQGSCFFITDTFVVTAKHCIDENDPKVRIGIFFQKDLSEGRNDPLYFQGVAKCDDRMDLAIIPLDDIQALMVEPVRGIRTVPKSRSSWRLRTPDPRVNGLDGHITDLHKIREIDEGETLELIELFVDGTIRCLDGYSGGAVEIEETSGSEAWGFAGMVLRQKYDDESHDYPTDIIYAVSKEDIVSSQVYREFSLAPLGLLDQDREVAISNKIDHLNRKRDALNKTIERFQEFASVLPFTSQQMEKVADAYVDETVNLIHKIGELDVD